MFSWFLPIDRWKHTVTTIGDCTSLNSLQGRHGQNIREDSTMIRTASCAKFNHCVPQCATDYISSSHFLINRDGQVACHPLHTPSMSFGTFQPSEVTNTLVLTGLSQGFFRLDVLEELRNLFASYGEINQWVKLSTLSRIIIVYTSEEDAMRAKAGCIVLLRCIFSDQYVELFTSSSTTPLAEYLSPKS